MIVVQWFTHLTHLVGLHLKLTSCQWNMYIFFYTDVSLFTSSLYLNLSSRWCMIEFKHGACHCNLILTRDGKLELSISQQCWEPCVLPGVYRPSITQTGTGINGKQPLCSKQVKSYAVPDSYCTFTLEESCRTEDNFIESSERNKSLNQNL